MYFATIGNTKLAQWYAGMARTTTHKHYLGVKRYILTTKILVQYTAILVQPYYNKLIMS